MSEVFQLTPPTDENTSNRIRAKLLGVEAWKRAYPARPGSGPEGETCKSCKHITRKHMAKTYIKCLLMRAAWTGGGCSDVKTRSPACAKWEAT